MTDVVNSVSFNASQDAFLVCLQKGGLRIFNTHPLVHKGVVETGGVKTGALLNRTNLIPFAAGGPHAKFAENTLLLWDAEAKELAMEITLESPVIAIRINHSKLLVCLHHAIHVFAFGSKGCVKLGSLDTRGNPKGLSQLSSDPNQEIMVFPGRKTGSVQLVASTSPVTINAHQSEVAALALNLHGTLMATGSQLGTLVRVWDTRSRLELMELRRGSDPASLHGLVFSPDSAFLAVSSDKATLHIFAVRHKAPNKKTLLQQVGIVTEDASRSLAQITLPTSSPAAIAFPSDHSVVAICEDGTYHKFSFTTEGATNREGFDLFLQVGDDAMFWHLP